MRVISLFDGIAGARLALERASIEVDAYFASEVDKYAIKIAMSNWNDIQQMGNVTNWREWHIPGWDVPGIDLLIGGSPCQGFSNAGKGLNFEDPRSMLFFTYVDILRAIKPKYFILENVRMKREWQDIITGYLGVEPIEINSSLLSAQHRTRLYWTNIEGVKQPEHTGVTLSDILLPIDEIGKKYYLSIRERQYMDREVSDGRTHWDFAHYHDTGHNKSHVLPANLYKGVPYNVLIDRRKNKCIYAKCDFWDEESCLCRFGDSYQSGYVVTSALRKLDPIECERLQTYPDDYTAGVSNTQRYKALGNSFTVDVIAHILKSVR